MTVFASASIVVGHSDKDPKNHNQWITVYLLRETDEKHNGEDGTKNTDAIEKRMKDKCDEMAIQWLLV